MPSQKPIQIVPKDGGQLWDIGGSLICKVDSAATQEAFTVLELVLAPGGGPPLHVHQREDEVFYILEGECTVGDEAQAIRAQPGTTVVFPKKTPHFFRNDGPVACRVSITAVPGGLDRYFAEIAQAVANGNPETVAEINRKYEIEFFPPFVD